ncbi:MAG: DUF4129 domain-containing protein, partial [Actinobacteria bacterium]|nr:DUF4129 domain-containing protein [Actinomycetota bacterium]
FIDYVATLAVLVALLGVVVAVVVVVFNRGARTRRKSSQLRKAAMLLVFTAGLSLAALLSAEFLRGWRNGASGDRVPLVLPAIGKGADAREQERYTPQFRWLPFAVVGGMVLVVGGAALAPAVRRRRAETGADAAAALSRVVDEALDDLWNESDPRRAVIAAYARMERVLGAHGFPRRSFEAPLEYLSRILLDLDVRASSVLALTELFERAKFSPHDIDRSMKEEAIAALVSIRDELRATP